MRGHSKLDKILDGGLYTTDNGQADYRTGKVRQQIKALILELAKECTHPGETDRNGIGRFHENGIIDPTLFSQKVAAL